MTQDQSALMVHNIVIIADRVNGSAKEFDVSPGTEVFLGHVVRVAGAQVSSVGLRIPTNP